MAKKILVVEDNDLNRKLFVSLLQERGYEIFEAADGREALDTIRKESPSLVLMDIILPKMSGFEVFNACKEEGLLGKTKVYALTAAVSNEIRNAGFDGIVAKPVRASEFVETVKKALTVDNV